MRHGEYFTNYTTQLDMLTEKGEKDLLQLATLLRPFNLHVSTIFHSEKHRAKQTAEIISKGFVCDLPIQARKGINPNDNVAIFFDEIANWSDDVLVIGHLPFMGNLTSLLLMGSESEDMINFQPGTLVCLETRARFKWAINWMLTPDLFFSSV
jgi:phosphohistidine phosphatase